MVRNLLQYISDLYFLFILSDFGFELQFSKKYSYNCKGNYNLFVHSQHSQEMALKYHFNENFCTKPWITTANTVFISSAGSNLQLIIVNWILQLRIWIGLFWSAEGSIAPSWHFVNLADLCKLKDKYENRTTATYKLKCFERTRFSITSEGGKFVKFQMASTKLSHHVYLYQIEY